MQAKVGRYFFGRHYSRWGIWQWNYANGASSSAMHIKDVFTYEEAVKEMYRLNGWGEPKYVRKVS